MFTLLKWAMSVCLSVLFLDIFCFKRKEKHKSNCINFWIVSYLWINCFSFFLESEINFIASDLIKFNVVTFSVVDNSL